LIYSGSIPLINNPEAKKAKKAKKDKTTISPHILLLNPFIIPPLIHPISFPLPQIHPVYLSSFTKSV
jgi:hypothetical protein